MGVRCLTISVPSIGTIFPDQIHSFHIISYHLHPITFLGLFKSSYFIFHHNTFLDPFCHQPQPYVWDNPIHFLYFSLFSLLSFSSTSNGSFMSMPFSGFQHAHSVSIMHLYSCKKKLLNKNGNMNDMISHVVVVVLTFVYSCEVAL